MVRQSEGFYYKRRQLGGISQPQVSEGQCNRLSILTQRKDESTDSEQVGSIIITLAVTLLVARRKKGAALIM